MKKVLKRKRKKEKKIIILVVDSGVVGLCPPVNFIHNGLMLWDTKRETIIPKKKEKRKKKKKKKAKIPNLREDQIDSINLGGIIQLPVQLTT